MVDRVDLVEARVTGSLQQQTKQLLEKLKVPNKQAVAVDSSEKDNLSTAGAVEAVKSVVDQN